MEVRDLITDAIRFWERGRVLYNGVLLLVSSVAALAGGRLATINAAGLIGSLAGIAVLAVLANLVYCLAYPVDIFVQCSDFREPWRKWRWLLLATGTILASLLAVFISYVSAFPLFASG